MDGLKRELGVREIFAISTGAMISSGLFVLPAIIYQDLGSFTFIAYILASFFILPTLLVKMELVTAMPKAGGDYFYIERAIGGIIGMFGGIANWLTLGFKSAFALIGIGGFVELLGPEFTYYHVQLIALSFLALIFIFNLLSVELAAKFEIILVYILLAILGFYSITGITHIDSELLQFKGRIDIFKLIIGAGVVFISFGGLTKVASIAEEAKRPPITIPRGMVLSFVVVSILYVLVVFITTGLLTPEEFSHTLEPISLGGKKVAGILGFILLSFAAISAFLTTANAGLLSSSRVLFAMARDGLLPSIFGRVHRKFHTPFWSLLLTTLFMGASIIWFDLKSLVKVASVVMLFLFVIVHLSYIILRASRLKNYNPTYKAPLFPLPSIFAIGLYGFLIYELSSNIIDKLLIFFAVPLVVYLFYGRKVVRRRSALLHLIEKVINKEIGVSGLEEELKEIIVERDRITLDRFDRLIERTQIIDIEKRVDCREFFKIVANYIARWTGIEENKIYQLLIKREMEASNVIAPFIALPHIILPGKGYFFIIPFRAKNGIMFGDKEVKAGFVLAGTMDERTFHLISLMAIAEIIRKPKFLEKWLKLSGEKELKRFLIESRETRVF